MALGETEDSVHTTDNKEKNCEWLYTTFENAMSLSWLIFF